MICANTGHVDFSVVTVNIKISGFNQPTAYKICNPRASGFLDKCPMLWYTFRDFGYITGYGEDAASISTFNYIKKGIISNKRYNWKILLQNHFL